MVQITLPDGSQRQFPQPVTVAEVAASIGAGLAKAALGGKVDGQLVDTSYSIAQDAKLAIVTAKDADGLELPDAEPERVPEGTGYLGPVDDPVAMARGVVEVWQNDYAGRRQRSLALASAHNRWPQTFEQLINVEYAAALAARDARMQGTWLGPVKRALNVS